MPVIKSLHVVSFSSEDRNHPAENLLKADGTHKWKGAKVGEKQLSIVLQFEKACQIHSIDVGNEGSAFVEILVGRSSSSETDFQVLLVTSSFMSPMESRNGTNRNTVRMFGPDKLSKTTAGQKWDRAKLVCTQPFNKTATYGLSFVKFHAPPEPGEKVEKAPSEQGSKTLGKFRLKTDDDEKTPLKIGTLFSKREEAETASVKPTMAAAIHTASRQAEQVSITSKPMPIKVKSSETAPQTKPTTPTSSQKRKHSIDDEEKMSQKTPLRKQSTSVSSVSSSGKRDTPPPLKKTKSEPPKESPAKELKKLMEGVVFVLSGFTNPRRGDIRDEALKMGAQYKPDWGRDCTHLICAFPNTPKYNSILGKGKIVTRHWVHDCYRKKQLLPWRKYRCEYADTPSESSEDEEKIIPKKKPPPPMKKPPPEKTEAYEGDTDVEDDSGEDTEDELRKLKEKQCKVGQEQKSDDKTKAKTEMKQKGDDPYAGSTDEDEPDSKSPVKSKPDEARKNQTKLDDHDDSDSGLPELPDFFTDKQFFLFGDFGVSERRLLTRYITAFDGSIVDYMAHDVNFVVTHSPWDKNFDDALSDSPSIVFVKPKWIFLCNEKNKLVPYQPYVVVPQ